VLTSMAVLRITGRAVGRLLPPNSNFYVAHPIGRERNVSASPSDFIENMSLFISETGLLYFANCRETYSPLYTKVNG
jgi:hypothetical protein